MRHILPLLVLVAPSAAQWSTDQLTEARWGLGAAAVGSKAIFAGGINNNGLPTDTIDIYDTSTGQWAVANLSIARATLAATTVGTKAMFGGGGDNIAVMPRLRVDVYDDATGTWSTAALSQKRTSLAATTVGTKALFAGGFGATGNGVPRVDIYDDSTGTWTQATLSSGRGDLAATSVGTKALFAGGWGAGPSDVVDIYDDSTGTWSTATLSAARERLAATTLGTRAYFAGGGTTALGDMDVVDIYDDATGTWSTATLSETREFLAGTSVGGEVLFGGGYNGVAGISSSTVDLETSGTWSVHNLSAARWGLAATTVGNQAFFAGGAGSLAVDIYTSGGSVGTNYCGPANTNSSGMSATISGFGSDIASANNLSLTASSMPLNQFGMFVNSMAQGFVNPPGSQGNLCLSGAIGRHNADIKNTGTSGEFSLDLDLNAVPTPGGSVAVQSGETWYWQTWFRDLNPTSTSNFTDGLCVLFQ